ncbi:BZ3500_MvSof-1268-A1-R1_Chr3-1g05695 [Microbotryum saponariae]|uniref:BZ3500_MvSof-1268-A1-R1_Chr3-1g05695 protein n=1 Tax=Microbotryum saponariae TaxID=289078 RepID=A0A2X0M6M9_9BASI|nr:BZ3500_MvSof-1268-A1-R1_Chr3-1g05695 [Microbotryum saponariae]SDA04885.1 BZ3501_MvSof-1269-A2-R1_Chr3-1g05365 [Microbotryum saponariae]
MSDKLGITPACFTKLVQDLRIHTTLTDSRFIQLEQKVGFLLQALRHSDGVRKVGHRFQHSTSTIAMYIHEVVEAIMTSKLYGIYVHQPTPDEPTSGIITRNPKLQPYFGHCIGALDGTHNVFAVCSFDLLFLHLHAGSEGSAHDQKVLAWAIEKGFQIPGPVKYYLGDAGYTMSENIMVPYRGVRYHLREWIAGARSSSRETLPSTKQELFNLRHAQLRNVVERIFGVVQRKFSILTGSAPEYNYKMQAMIPLLCAFLHNHVHINDPFNRSTGKARAARMTMEAKRARLEIIYKRTEEALQNPAVAVDEEVDDPPEDQPEGLSMEATRNEISDRMWIDYLKYKDGPRRRQQVPDHLDELLLAFDHEGLLLR